MTDDFQTPPPQHPTDTTPPPAGDAALETEEEARRRRSRYHAQTISMTDFGSEPDDSETRRASNTTGPDTRRQSMNMIPSVTGPVGESGLPPSRPTTSATGVSSNAWSQTNPARRGLHAPSAGAPSVGSAATSRPPTAGSKTHVPSLTSHAFFKPMSSQRLQAQRQQRTNSTGRRQVFGEQSIPRHQRDASFDDRSPPKSRDTDATDIGDRDTTNPSPDVAETVRSQGESIAPLNRPSGLKHLNIDKANRNGTGSAGPTPTKSPRSFRSSFILPSRRSKTNSIRQETSGHEKLSSAASSPHFPASHGSAASVGPPAKELVKQQLGKNYEYFSGNTVFCWGGRLQNTRDRPVNIATGILAILPTGLFLGYSGPWLWLHVSPAIPIIFAYIFLIVLSSFIHASVTDPGILPRNLHPHPPSEPNEDPLALGPPTTAWTLVLTPSQPHSAMEVPTKYCKSCNIWRPPRAHHCRVCDNCVETQDHHCVWLNNCVGRRNYRYFFAFVSSAALLGIFLFAASLGHLVAWKNQNNRSFGDAIDAWRVPFAMMLYGILITPYPLSLTGYHIFLMARGETTREYLNSHKFLPKDRHRPFSQGFGLQGWWSNWVAVLARPRPPTYLHFKKEYVEGDRRFGERRGRRTAPLKEEYQGGRGWRDIMLGAGKVGNGNGNGVEMRDLAGGSGNVKVGSKGGQ